MSAKFAALLGLVAILITTLLRPAAADPSVGAKLAYDFLLENVCLDDKGKVLVGVSPIDGDPKCVAQRNLNPGERLPYHEQEWQARGASDLGQDVFGTDSIPVKTRALGIVGIHLYYRRPIGSAEAFGRYDPLRRIGGGTIAAVSDDMMAFVATELGRQNLKLFVGRDCRPGQAISAEGLRDSWALAPLARLATVKIPAVMPASSAPIATGVLSTPSHIVDAGGGPRCPVRISSGSTRWSIRPVTYRAVYKSGPLAGKHVRLWTLIATRAGRPAEARDSAAGFERAYFTRELGWTRWEAWKSMTAHFRGPKLASPSPGPNPQVLRAHQAVIARHNCELPEGTAADSSYRLPTAPQNDKDEPRPDMIVVGCVEVTQIVPPREPQGDPPPTGPETWYGSIINHRTMGAVLFGQ